MTKELWIVAGPNGAGKSTWVEGALGPQGPRYLGADQIAAEISPEQPDLAKIPAGREFLRRLRRGIEADEHLVIETTLSGKSIGRYLEMAHSRDYWIAIVFVFLATPDLCVERVRHRVLKGGHDVPQADIRRRYRRAKVNFWETYRHQADEWHLFYNAAGSFHLVATGTPDHDSVLSEELFDLFMESRFES